MATPVDPVLEAMRNAPVDELPETEEERRMVQEARDGLARGERTYTQEEIEAEVEAWKQRELAKK